MLKGGHIALGTAAIGRPVYINIKQEDPDTEFSLEAFRKKGVEVLETAYRKGVRHFDTAPNYGLAEDLLIDWIKEKNDPSLIVSTKWGYTYVANFDPNATEHEIKEHSLNKLNEQWAVSRALLPHLKLYQIHSATFESGVLENTEVLNQLYELKKKFGLIIGLTVTGSNQVDVLKKALTVQVENEGLFQSVQFTFNLLDQSVATMKNELEQLDSPILIKEVLANGRLIPNDDYKSYAPLYNEMKGLAKKYRVGADAIALRFAMDSFKNANVLSGASNEAHLMANLKADTFSLAYDEMDRLRSFAIAPSAYWNERKELQWN
ncbi:aldo/keto reductase [Maribacter flavus]|uniref:Aldo/keto reductase n=1 Tax=Maribacter flavus TaxID=1658664 RepID=A0A5B2TRZ2_9FLAO|nr:aldo/keto reductase [Maribacter flavus]KAA2217387.1 aldo/keto reductase [Maribacter flavus]